MSKYEKGLTLSPIEIIVAERVLPLKDPLDCSRLMDPFWRKVLKLLDRDARAKFASKDGSPTYDLSAAYRYGRLLGIRGAEFGVEGMLSPWQIVLEELGQIAEWTSTRDIGLSAPHSHRRVLLNAIRKVAEGAVRQLNDPPLTNAEQAVLYRLSSNQNRRRRGAEWLASYVAESPNDARLMWRSFAGIIGIFVLLEPDAEETRSIKVLFRARVHEQQEGKELENAA